MDNHFLYHAAIHEFERQPQQKLGDGMMFQHFHTGEVSLVRWDFKKGATIPKHHHASEQITWLQTGSARVIVGEKENEREVILKTGQIMIIPSNVPHEFHILEDCIDIDIFHPIRQDWIDNLASFYKK